MMVRVPMGSPLLGVNQLLAQRNRAAFARSGALVLNLMSSPGSGKTTILERTIEQLAGRVRLAVIEGDLYTDQDARRIEGKGAAVVQINTQGACHLDADMVWEAWQQLAERQPQVLFIENVGNLVCPAEFDLGEAARVAVMSVTEGNDKPTKYPLLFRQASVVLLNKVDLLGYTDFSLERFRDDVGRINPRALVFELSARTGEGLAPWCQWLEEQVLARSEEDELHGRAGP
ncbi:MAG: hydrogenase nickel incorporation protein HypB [Syntrophomonadaceae bacterium]|nr:hydrogenase nickel incorporation protein HypB [Syntrophomonadaceae bacterium]MDH7497570.1 hydrogenase nickel incorporation protein HypB [Syntrophomonadaceae bacterium]